MQNRFKFRVWDKLAEHFYYADSPARQHFILSLDGKFCNLQNGVGGDEVVIQQFTGLKDKNGKEIYEGDILECIGRGETFTEDLIGEVGFEDFEYVILTTNDKWPCASFSVLENKKVIGNIFETPELLKQ